MSPDIITNLIFGLVMVLVGFLQAYLVKWSTDRMVARNRGASVDVEQPAMEVLGISRASTLVAHEADEDQAGSGGDMCEEEQIRNGPKAGTEDHDTLDVDQNVQQQR